jgi:hypothetical protein
VGVSSCSPSGFCLGRMKLECHAFVGKTSMLGVRCTDGEKDRSKKVVLRERNKSGREEKKAY